MGFDKRLPPFRVPEEMAERLENLVDQTGRSLSFYLREAVSMSIDELERIYLAEAEEIRKKKEGKK